MLPLDNMVPELVWLTAASTNDKDFLGQLKPQKGSSYVFDKGYVNYTVYKRWQKKDNFMSPGSTKMQIMRWSVSFVRKPMTFSMQSPF